MDRFSWIVIGVVGVLLLAAVGVATLRPAQNETAQEVYLEEDTPEAVVHDMYVAFLKHDVVRMKGYFSQRVRENFEQNQRWPEIQYYPDTSSRRMRIVTVEIQGQDRAMVTMDIDNYSPGGLFSSNNVWTNRQLLSLVREEDSWKIDSENFYFY